MTATHIDPPCALCGNTTAERVAPIRDVRGGTSYEGWAVRCESCGLVRVDPLPPPDQIAAYYPSGYGLHDESAISRSAILGRRWLAGTGPLQRAGRHAYNLLAFRSLPEGAGRLLDVGAGIGQYVADMTEVGWDAQGVEPSAGAVELARRTGRRVQHGDVFASFLNEERFDVVSFWHVLEHVHEPVAALRRAHSLLRAGGRLMLAVPNWDSWMRERVGSSWWALEAPRHVHHFTTDTLRRTLETSGFAVEFVRPKARGSMVAGSLAVKRAHAPILRAPDAHVGHWAMDLALAVANRTDSIWACARRTS